MSTLRVNTIQNSGGTGSPEINGLARAWVNFNGTGTVAIRASYNVSSITDNGTGNYDLNFTTAMTDANYSTSGMVRAASSNWATIYENPDSPVRTTTQLRIYTVTGASLADSAFVSISVFR